MKPSQMSELSDVPAGCLQEVTLTYVLNSINKNHNITWDNGTYSTIINSQTSIKASDEKKFKIRSAFSYLQNAMCSGSSTSSGEKKMFRKSFLDTINICICEMVSTVTVLLLWCTNATSCGQNYKNWNDTVWEVRELLTVFEHVRLIFVHELLKLTPKLSPFCRRPKTFIVSLPVHSSGVKCFARAANQGYAFLCDS